jgi:hypothetical protein
MQNTSTFQSCEVFGFSDYCQFSGVTLLAVVPAPDKMTTITGNFVEKSFIDIKQYICPACGDARYRNPTRAHSVDYVGG